MTDSAFVEKWRLRFRDNDLFLIDEAALREFAQDIADTFGADDPRAVFEHIFENQYGKHPEFSAQAPLNAFVLQLLTAKQVVAAPEAPEFSLFDDAANTVVLSHPQYSSVDLRYDLPNGAGTGLKVPADGVIRPGNIAGQLVGYVRAAGGRLQSDKAYSPVFTSVTLTPQVQPSAPRLTNFDDVANTVGVYHPNYSYVDLRYNFNGQTGLLVSSDGLISVGNVAGQVEVYVVANPEQNRVQSLPAYSQPFTMGSVVTPPTPTPLAVAFTLPGGNTVTAGQNLSFSAAASGGVAPYSHEVSATNGGTGVVVGIGAAVGAQYSGVWQSVPAGEYDLVDTVTDAAGTVKISTSRHVVATAGSPVTAPAQVATPTGQAGSGAVTLTWVVPASNGAAITSYTVRYRPVGATTYSVFGTTGNLTAIVSGLANNTAYELTVAATNSAGTGAPSNPVTVTPVASGGARVADVYALVFNQSNGSGASESVGLPANLTAQNERVGIYYHPSGALVPYNSGHNQALTRALMGGDARYPLVAFGPDMSFVPAWLADPANEGKELHIIKIFVEGVANSDGANLFNWNKAGGLFDQLLEQWNGYKTWAAANDCTYTIRVAFSEIGEQDSNDGNLNFLADYRTSWGKAEQQLFAPQTPIKVVELKVRPQDTVIAGEQIKYVLGDNRAILVRPNPDFIFDGTHFTQDETLLRGPRIYNALKAGLAPTLTTLSPGSGGIGSYITLLGTNFKANSTVRFNSVAAPEVSVLSDIEIRVKVPVGTPATATVYVTTDNGTASKAGFTLTSFAGFVAPLEFNHDSLDHLANGNAPAWSRTADPDALNGYVHFSNLFGQWATKKVRITSPQRLHVFANQNTGLGWTRIDFLQSGVVKYLFEFSQNGPMLAASLDRPTFITDVLAVGDYDLIIQKRDDTPEYVVMDSFAFRNA
ncbi:fibronectin type III domain-containing protein [Hymenobacter sp. BT186]|uniref:Fibronectin type III domain-containing protein n=1 Tax=Hymenobacter telluris TaxID=2816474 RepID=A0A939F3E9_9BACT|nr:fibronectin type III domain-containing protein [Hymenobacter telluris]MBO0360668.1 fibronectin type III domain-containing protein [Hymenobacter telluris]MBW3376695.1 fibronectin type III domain-containing protein [Hymenobacter norwichensis]